MMDLLEIERWGCFSKGQKGEGKKKQTIVCDYFTNHICLKMLSVIFLSNEMMRGYCGKLSSALSSERTRCSRIPCGVRLKHYLAG